MTSAEQNRQKEKIIPKMMSAHSPRTGALFLMAGEEEQAVLHRACQVHRYGDGRLNPCVSSSSVLANGEERGLLPSRQPLSYHPSIYSDAARNVSTLK
mmetsp:Transcript_7736/g.15637  ORF Transcript_7736/g.15637 Transcript_7736/m.15637 type:complete len:98 (-) Transcript_7736:63-356(-)